MCFLNYIMFIIVMVMSCDIVSYITFMLYFLCKLILSLHLTNSFILATLYVSLALMVLCFFITTSLIKFILCFLYIMHFIHFIVIENISWILVNMLIDMLFVLFGFSIIRSFIKIIFNISSLRLLIITYISFIRTTLNI